MSDEELEQKIMGVKVKAIIAFMLPLALVIMTVCGGIAFVFGQQFEVKSFLAIVGVLSGLTATVVNSYFQSEERRQQQG